MARYYRKRGFGRYKKRFYKRRFGVGGGNRKRPSSYEIAYGFTKVFDQALSRYADNRDRENLQQLSLCSYVMLSTSLTQTQKNVLDQLPNPAAELAAKLFMAPCVNHVQDFTFGTLPNARLYVPAAHTFGVFESETLLSFHPTLYALKHQFKDALQRCTKRNLPFALAVSSWSYNYLKNKKKKKKLYFWKYKSVPRFLLLITLQLRDAWKPLKYGQALEDLFKELSMIINLQNERQLLRLAQAGVPEARAELERRHRVPDNAVNTPTSSITALKI